MAEKKTHKTHLRLTRRGKIVAALLAVIVLWGAAMFALPTAQAEDAGQPMEVTSYVVGSGDTMWKYASMITPQGEDVNDSIDYLMELNNLDSTTLTPGERIVVPTADIQ